MFSNQAALLSFFIAFAVLQKCINEFKMLKVKFMELQNICFLFFIIK